MSSLNRLRAAWGLALFAVALPATASAQSNVEGNWVVENKSSIITIARCGGELCGRISRFLKPPRYKADINNPDPKLRNRPFLGLTILSGFKPGNAPLEGGNIYDPSSGRTYKSKISMNPDGSLKVSGCVAFICKSQRWQRAS